MTTISVLVTPLLHWIPRGIPEHTDHGILHSTNVLRYIRDISNEYPIKFKEEERFILALSAVLHDLGCLTGRENHNEKTLKILAKNQFDLLRFLLGSLHYRVLQQVIIAHSRSFYLNQISDDPSPDIRLKFISAIFRLADACDISSLRVKKLLLEILVEEDLLDKTSEKIWKSHLQIENILIKETKIKPQIYNKTLAKTCLDALEEEIDSVNGVLSENSFPIFTLEPEEVERDIKKQP